MPLQPIHTCFRKAYTEWTDDDIETLWNLYTDNIPIHSMCKELKRFPDEIAFKLVEPETEGFVNNTIPVTFDQIPGFESTEHLQMIQIQKEALDYYPLFQLRKQFSERRELVKEVTREVTREVVRALQNK
jgi:hypothetical protein